MYNRNFYIQKLLTWKGKPLIKIITGIRRSGKSTLLRLFIEELKSRKVSQKNILYINKESLEYDFLNDYKKLNKFVTDFYNKRKRKIFLFIDEVQLIEKWEKVIISFFSNDIADIYLTGSNADLFSEELSTLLGGRYIEMKILPLSFSEFLTFRQIKTPTENDFAEYLKYGGMPGIHHLHWETSIIYEYLNAVFDTIVLKDIVKRYGIRNVSFLEKIIRFVFDNISQIFSAKSVVDFLKKEQRRTNIETVYNYINYLEKSFVIRRSPRYDIKGKRFLEVREKYFLTDVGLRHALLGFKENDIAQLLENVLFLELLKRNYKVYTGQINGKEIDFIVEKDDTKAYIQVSYILANDKIMKREFEPLLAIKDNYPKYVMTLDKFFANDFEGIRRINIIDFLLDENFKL